jgi:hypothetical protein
MTKFDISQGMMSGIEWRVEIKIHRIRSRTHPDCMNVLRQVTKLFSVEYFRKTGRE